MSVYSHRQDHHDSIAFSAATAFPEPQPTMVEKSTRRVTPELRTRLQWLYGGPHELSQDIQLCLLMQPNCPGCVLHAMPTINALSSSKLNFDTYVVATAFEDFEYNTIESARNLLAGGQLVGASASTLRCKTYSPASPKVPFAFDNVVDRSRASTETKNMALKALLENARDQLKERHKMPSDLIDHTLRNVGHKALPDKIAELFWTVKAQGTPTWIVHRYNGEILGMEFGHKSEKELQEWIHQLITVQLTQV